MAWKNVQYENGKYRTSSGGGGGASEFADLDDVSFSNLQNGQVPKYNSTTQKWENANESGGGGSVNDVEVNGTSVVNQQGVAEITMPNELSDLSDVAFSSLQDHQPLRYNATSQKWVNGADSYPPIIYSDTEREVGVWRDGKPLYQKTISLTFTIDSANIVEINIGSNIIVQNAEGYCSSYTGQYVDLFAHVNTAGLAYSLGAWIETPYLKIRGGNGMYGSYTGSVTIQYTKTTDIPGSGTWTTQGAYAHHYSTDEHVVGTWIDGKPIYEKTWDLGQNITVGSWTTVMSVAGVNINKIVNSISTQDDPAVSFIEYWVDGTTLKGNSLRQSGDDYVRYLTLQYTKTTD